MQKLINLWLIKIFFFSLFLLTNVDANNDVNLVRDSTNNTINILEKQNNTYQPNEAEQMCLMSYRISSVAISVPIGLINLIGASYSLQFNNSALESLFIIGYSTTHLITAYYLGKYGLTDKFIFNGYIGPNYTHVENIDNRLNLGGSLSFYTGFKFANHFSAGFEFNFLYRTQINKESNRVYWNIYDSTITTYNGESLTKESIIYIPITIKHNFKFNKDNSLSTGVGFGYPLILKFNKTYNDTLLNVIYSDQGGGYSANNEETKRSANKARTMIKIGFEYRRYKNIIRSSLCIDNYVGDYLFSALSDVEVYYNYENSVNTFSIEYGRSFK